MGFCHIKIKREFELPRIILCLLVLLLGSPGAFAEGQNDFPTIDSVRENMFSTSLVAPVRIIEIGKNHYFVDFGKDTFGTLVITSRSRQTGRLVVHLGEKLSNQTSIDRDPGGSIRYQKVKLSGLLPQQELTLKLPPDSKFQSRI